MGLARVAPTLEAPAEMSFVVAGSSPVEINLTAILSVHAGRRHTWGEFDLPEGPPVDIS